VVSSAVQLPYLRHEPLNVICMPFIRCTILSKRFERNRAVAISFSRRSTQG
jgi:hypothetical protein